MRLSPTSFAAAPSGPSALAARRRVGATVGFTLTAPAGVWFTVVSARTGRLGKGGRCLKATKKNRRARGCTRLVPVRGSFVVPGHAGTNSSRFTGRLNGRRLPLGPYRLIPTPLAGTKLGRSVGASFLIIT
jgi:hypothetical protein